MGIAKVLNQETVQLAELFAQAKPGETVTFEQMSKTIGRDIATCRWFIQCAHRIVLREHNAVFAPVRGEGYRRLLDEEIPAHAMRSVRRIRNTAKKGARELASVDYAGLSPEKKMEHNLQMSLFSAITYSTESTQIKKIRGAVQSSGLSLPIPNCLDALK